MDRSKTADEGRYVTKFSIKIPQAGEPFVIEVSAPDDRPLTLSDVTDALREAVRVFDRLQGKPAGGGGIGGGMGYVRHAGGCGGEGRGPGIVYSGIISGGTGGAR